MSRIMTSINRTIQSASKQVLHESRFGGSFEAQLGVHRDGLEFQELKDGSYVPSEGSKQLSPHGSSMGTVGDSEGKAVGNRGRREMLLASKKLRKAHIVVSANMALAESRACMVAKHKKQGKSALHEVGE